MILGIFRTQHEAKTVSGIRMDSASMIGNVRNNGPEMLHSA
jgi:hypothetical protein